MVLVGNDKGSKIVMTIVVPGGTLFSPLLFIKKDNGGARVVSAMKKLW